MKPIYFSADDVRAILDGNMTATRLVVKPQPESKDDIIYRRFLDWYISPDDDSRPECKIKSPYQNGDVLYVRETWGKYTPDPEKCYPALYFKASEIVPPSGIKWRSPSTMPKAHARLFLHIKNVRAERLQDIDYEGCKAYGIWDDYKASSEKSHEFLMKVAYVKTFAELWDNALKKAARVRYGWRANPWVWVIEFERIEKEDAERYDKLPF